MYSNGMGEAIWLEAGEAVFTIILLLFHVMNLSMYCKFLNVLKLNVCPSPWMKGSNSIHDGVVTLVLE